MKIIFLDVDGVLNSKRKLIEVYNKTNKAHSGYSYPFDDNCLKNLKLLIEFTNASIVITSTWKNTKEGLNILLDILSKYNLDKNIVGYTKNLNSNRELEIISYLNDLNEELDFIILDDDSNFEKLLPYLIKTNNEVGLIYDNVLESIELFNKLSLKRTRNNL